MCVVWLRLLAPRIIAFARCCNVESEAGNLRGASRSTQGAFYRRTPVGTGGSGEVLVTLNALGGAHGQIQYTQSRTPSITSAPRFYQLNIYVGSSPKLGMQGS
jgi:hypothetical protein